MKFLNAPPIPPKKPKQPLNRRRQINRPAAITRRRTTVAIDHFEIEDGPATEQVVHAVPFIVQPLADNELSREAPDNDEETGANGLDPNELTTASATASATVSSDPEHIEESVENELFSQDLPIGDTSTSQEFNRMEEATDENFSANQLVSKEPEIVVKTAEINLSVLEMQKETDGNGDDKENRPSTSPECEELVLLSRGILTPQRTNQSNQSNDTETPRSILKRPKSAWDFSTDRQDAPAPIKKRRRTVHFDESSFIQNEFPEHKNGPPHFDFGVGVESDYL